MVWIYCPNGLVDGDQKGTSILFKFAYSNIQDIPNPNIAWKTVPAIRSKVIDKIKLKFWNFMTDFILEIAKNNVACESPLCAKIE